MASRPGGKRSREMEPEPRRKRSKQLPPDPSELETNLHNMASEPRRRRSKELPPDLSELMNKLIKAANSFIQQFNIKESRMREIVRELQKISKKVKSMQRNTDKVRTAGVIGGGVALGLGIVGAFLTGGLSLAVCGAAAAADGAAVVTNVYKMWSESGSAEKVEKLGKEFKQIVEPLKGILEEIQETCEKLEVEAAEAQSGNTLKNMEEFEEILRRVSELKDQSLGALFASESLIEVMENLLILIVNVLRLTATPEEDRELRDAIIQSADQSQEVIDEFKKTKTLLNEILN